MISSMLQGFVLGPALLLLYINNIQDQFQSKLLMRASSIVRYRVMTSTAYSKKTSVPSLTGLSNG